jgi:hemerythrin-like domain-containing protein
MKRHPALASLSRDHQHTLAVAQRLRRATPATAAQAVAAFLAVWELEEKLHFRAEEEVLLPAYAAHGDPCHPAVVRVLLDHLSIRADAQRLATEAPLQRLHTLGERLSSHVHFEERELFPLIEDTLSDDDLRALGTSLLSRSPPARQLSQILDRSSC